MDSILLKDFQNIERITSLESCYFFKSYKETGMFLGYV